MYSATIEGKILDYKFKELSHTKGCYNFYIGNIFLGQIFHMKRHWSAVSMAVPCVYGSVDGFKTRLDAAEFILKVYKTKGEK